MYIQLEFIIDQIYKKVTLLLLSTLHYMYTVAIIFNISLFLILNPFVSLLRSYGKKSTKKEEKKDKEVIIIITCIIITMNKAFEKESIIIIEIINTL